MPDLPPAATNGRESQNAWSRIEDFAFDKALDLAADGKPLHMRLARRSDFTAIERMIHGAKDRLKELGTDQWSDDWPDQAGQGRMDRVRASINKKNTWIAHFPVRYDSGILNYPVATVTTETEGSSTVWREHELREYPAVYLGRLVVADGFSSFDIGASIIDWAGYRGLESYDAASIRIDVWTTNTKLHHYYLKRGFKKCGQVADPKYPAGQRFERPTNYDSGLAREVLVKGQRQLRADELNVSRRAQDGYVA